MIVIERRTARKRLPGWRGFDGRSFDGRPGQRIRDLLGGILQGAISLRRGPNVIPRGLAQPRAGVITTWAPRRQRKVIRGGGIRLGALVTLLLIPLKGFPRGLLQSHNTFRRTRLFG